ncbi:hypothetical protein BpHYR1_053667 [Brachionus plicatilis]|uniref:Uncharacterized protein n=1 Tax=Brachionus plicatilis TaxID=10195 RepID=A0A3M7Q7A0_BRAPC|nr:hypothetical protein BpHYR1_053667 [Brachionus plicatilis]
MLYVHNREKIINELIFFDFQAEKHFETNLLTKEAINLIVTLTVKKLICLFQYIVPSEYKIGFKINL